MKRDFSENARQELLSLVSQVENEKWSNFTDWFGDRWYDFEDWIGSLNVKNYIDNVNTYHKKVIDKNNATSKDINSIFENVNGISELYRKKYSNLLSYLVEYRKSIDTMASIVAPHHGNFNSSYINSSLSESYNNLINTQVSIIIDTMKEDIDGEITYNTEIIESYLRKSPEDISSAENTAILKIISELSDLNTQYSTILTMSDEDVIAYIGHLSGYENVDEAYIRFIRAGTYYNDAYVKVLECILEKSKDANSFAASLLTLGNEEVAISILGVEAYQNMKDIFGTDSLKVYLERIKTEKSEIYLNKLESSKGLSFKSSADLEDIRDDFDDFKDKKEKQLKRAGLLKEKKKTYYHDEDGKKVAKKDAPDFYKRKINFGEIGVSEKLSATFYDKTFETLLGGTANVKVGEAEVHGSISGGFYLLDADGKQVFSPGVSAEFGGSVTAFEATYNNQLLGDEMLGVNVDGKVTALSASAGAELNVNFMGKDENGNVVFDPQVNVGVNAEAVLIEAEGSVGANVLGGEVELKGSVKVGVGAHADVGYKDGVFKCEIGASLGIGFDVGFEVDVGGMVDTVADAASSAWEGIKDGWNSFWGK